MLNSLESYRHAGQAAAMARQQRDEPRAKHWRDWAGRAWAMESENDRRTARHEYDQGYRRESERYARVPGGRLW